MLDLARSALRSALANAELPQPKEVPPRVIEQRACFITLTKSGALRGCIGQVLAQAPLYEAIMRNACHAALDDPRFSPVQVDELPALRIEVSVLTEPHPLSFASAEDLLSKLQPLQDGVLLQVGSRAATFLPQVWAQLTDKIEFMDQLAQKAGCSPESWRATSTLISIYHVECFAEPNAPFEN